MKHKKVICIRRQINFDYNSTPKGVCIAVLIAIAGALFYSHVQAQSMIDSNRFIESYSIPREVTLPQVVSDLRGLLGMRINIVEIPFTSNDELTIDSVIKLYDKKSSDSLKERERKLYQTAVRLRQSGSPGNTVIDIKKTTILFAMLPAESVDSIGMVKKLISLDGRYSFRVSNGSVIIFPKGMNIPSIQEFKINNVRVDKGYQELQEIILAPNGITLSSFNGELPGLSEPSKKVILDIQSSDLITCLTRFAEAIGPDVVWTIAGPISAQRVTFFMIPTK